MLTSVVPMDPKSTSADIAALPIVACNISIIPATPMASVCKSVRCGYRRHPCNHTDHIVDSLGDEHLVVFDVIRVHVHVEYSKLEEYTLKQWEGGIPTKMSPGGTTVFSVGFGDFR